MDNSVVDEALHRTRNHFALISFKDAYWSLSSKEREGFHKKWLSGLCDAAQKVDYHPAEETLALWK